MSKPPINLTPLATTLGVNGVVVCDCGKQLFKIGVAYNHDTGNNFIRILECDACGGQMPATHQSDAALAPSVGLGRA